MSPKEFLKEVLSTYFIVVTLVVVCMLVLKSTVRCWLTSL